MHYCGVFAVLLLNTAPLLAAPVQPSKAAVAPDAHLRAWLAADPKVQEKLARMKAPSFVEPGLKDAVADRPADPPSGLKPDCRDLKSCVIPPLAMDVPAGEPAEPAVLAMIQPWIWLADAKGVRLGVAHADAESTMLLAVHLPGLGLPSMELDISPRPEGGVHLWFGRGSELEAVYSRERAELNSLAAQSR